MKICGSKKNTVLQKQISMGNNKFVEFPIVTCDVCGFVYQAIKFSKDFYKDFMEDFIDKTFTAILNHLMDLLKGRK